MSTMLEFRKFKIVWSYRGTQLNKGTKTKHGEQKELSLVCFVDAKSYTSPESIVSTGSVPGHNPGHNKTEAKFETPVVCFGVPHSRKDS